MHKPKIKNAKPINEKNTRRKIKTQNPSRKNYADTGSENHGNAGNNALPPNRKHKTTEKKRILKLKNATGQNEKNTTDKSKNTTSKKSKSTTVGRKKHERRNKKTQPKEKKRKQTNTKKTNAKNKKPFQINRSEFPQHYSFTKKFKQKIKTKKQNIITQRKKFAA